MPVYQLKKQVYLDKFNKCYMNIISISTNPNDPSLNHIVKTIYSKLPRKLYYEY